jgi:hypothetical protein
VRACDEVSAVLRQREGLPDAELHVRANHFREWIARQEMTVMVARDQDGGTLAVLAATIDDSVCAIGFAMATCHEARWALHDHLVRILIARRVRYLLSADEGPFGALGYPTNVLHYQHLLGYELRHLIPVAAYRAARRRRRLALAVLTACAALVAPPVAQSAMVWKPPVSAARTRSHEPARCWTASCNPRIFSDHLDEHREELIPRGAAEMGQQPASSGDLRQRG